MLCSYAHLPQKDPVFAFSIAGSIAQKPLKSKNQHSLHARYPQCAKEASDPKWVKTKLDKLKTYSISLRKHSYQEGPAVHHHHHSIYSVIFQLKYPLSPHLTFSEQPTRFLLRISACPEVMSTNPLQVASTGQVKYNLSANPTPSTARAAVLEVALDLGDMHEEQVIGKRCGYLKPSSCHRGY